MSETWEYILGTEVRPDQLDEFTVLALQMYCPAHSSDDCENITKLFSDMKVFPSIRDDSERESIGRRVLTCRRIVTFASFFEDFIYLRTCFDGLRQLLPRNWRENGSFQQAFLNEWDDTTGGHDVAGLQPGHHQKNFQDCLAELWLFAMRNFPCLSDGKASQPLHYGNPINDPTEFRSLFSAKRAELACLASKLGFETDVIKRYKVDNPVHEDSPAPGDPEVSCNDCPLVWKQRFNRPSRTNFIQCREFLHRVHVYDAAVEQKKYVTAYAIARDIVHCCWRPDIERWVHGPEARQQQQHPNKKRSFGGTHDGPRQKMTRLAGNHAEARSHARKLNRMNREAIVKRRENQTTNENLTDDQQGYADLMEKLKAEIDAGFEFGDVATGFGLEGIHSGASATVYEEKDAGAKEQVRTTWVEEDTREQDELDVESKTVQSIQPLAATVEADSGRFSNISMTEGSDYSGANQRLDGDHPLFDDDWIPAGENDSSQQEVIPILQQTPEAILRRLTQSPSMLKPSSKAVSLASDIQTEQQYANNADITTVHNGTEHKDRSSRHSNTRPSGSITESGGSESNTLAGHRDNAAVSGSNDERKNHQVSEERLQATITQTSRNIDEDSQRRAKYRTVFPVGARGVVKEEGTDVAPLDHELSENRHAIFSMFPGPGSSGKVKGDLKELSEILSPKGKRKMGDKAKEIRD